MAKFEKGKSGNPNGRPKADKSLAALAREHTKEALGTLVEVMRDKEATASARVSAADSLLDRGYGKAPQTINLNDERDPEQMTDAEIIAELSRARAEAWADDRAPDSVTVKPH